jgi:hypothetical protein
MNPFILRLVIPLVISLVLRQLEKFGEAIDWSKVKADVEPRVRKIVPGTILDDAAVTFILGIISAFETTLKDEDLKIVLELLAKKDYLAAGQKLIDIIKESLGL